MSPQKKSMRAVGMVFTVYALLCATHLGEFWPFSIYPMFSSAGQPWSRAVVTEVDPDWSAAEVWQNVGMDDLLGEIVPLEEYGVAQKDLAGYLQRTQQWDDRQIREIAALFARYPTQDKHLLVYKVRGELAADDSVSIEAIPVLLIAGETAYPNPDLGHP